MIWNDSKITDSIEYLDKERKEMWIRLTALEKEVDTTTADYEKEAKASSRRASEFRNRTNETKIEAEKVFSEIQGIKSEVDGLKQSASLILTEANSILTGIRSEHKNSQTLVQRIIKDSESIQSKIESIESILEAHPNLSVEINELEENLQKSSENSTKINTAYKSILSRKEEIDELYFGIIGYTETNEETGDEVSVDGLKQLLTNQYNEIESKLKNLDTSLTTLQNSSQESYKSFTTSKQAELSTLILGWQEEMKSINKQISDLLPKALTAGLSFAYSEKKDNELLAYGRLKNQFYFGIFLIILVSLIPFAVSIYLLTHDEGLVDVIERIPRLVIAILPLYIPVLWVAISGSKKMNLSKRLIEEYTHKEVLSKTFEGLSTQIEKLPDSEMSEELKLRLLFNILQVSSENPGKLISNYQGSDHPIMEVLEQSSKLESLVEKLEKVPGMGKITNILNAKSKINLAQQAEKVKSGLDLVTSSQKNGNEESVT